MQRSLAIGVLGLLILAMNGARGQEPAATQPPAAQPPAAKPQPAAPAVRKLAPGVLTVIPTSPKTEETFQGPLPLTNITALNWTPNYTPKTDTLSEKAAKVVLRRNIWNLEFAFKPLRMVYVDIPQPTGKMQRKLIWYMVYRVKNNGQHLNPTPIKDQFGHTTFDTANADAVLNYGATAPSATLRFFPHFVLESPEVKKSYVDRVIPVAMPVIQARETRGAKLHNSVDISRVAIPVSTAEAEAAVWGVAMWEDIDPRTDFLSIYIQGLTNAYRLEPTAAGVVHQAKTLQLNFWRPSDTVDEHEKEIRYGVPAVSDAAQQANILQMYGLTERLDHRWVYR